MNTSSKMNKIYALILFFVLLIIYLLFIYNDIQESFVVMGNSGEILNPFNEPDKSGYIEPETSPPPKPKCCPISKVIETKNCPIQVNTCNSCSNTTTDCINKDYNCSLSPKMVCPSCPKLECPPCKPCQPVCPSIIPDLSKYVLKSSIPPCPQLPDMSYYILKSEIPVCPRMPDMYKYVLKSSVPPPIQCPTCPSCPACPQPPEVKVCEKILKEKDCGVCPPCPRVKCPEPKLECKVVKDKINTCKTERPGNNSSCIPKPYDPNEYQSPLLNND